MAFIDDIASKLSGRTRAETNSVMTDATTRTYVGTATSASEDGSVYVTLSQDVTLPDDDDGEHGLGVEMPTTVAVDEGDEVLVTVFGGGVMKAPVVTGNPGWGDSLQAQVDNAEALAEQAEAVAQEAAEDVEQVRQDVADFRDDVATTYATKVERQDGDDAVRTFITTNYTNSNDLATTYATKTLVSQTKDAIELAASQTYETQSDAAATYATKSALTVGLDGIRTEVAEDYQPKGDYATTASMNSAIQQSASSIESSVAATYTTKAEFDGLQVGGTNLASDVKLWYGRTASSEYTARGITVKQLGDGLYSATGTTTGGGDIWFQTTNIDAALSRDPGDYVMSVYVESGTWPSNNFYLQLAAYKSSDNTWNRNIRTANGSTSQAFTCETDYPRHFGFYSNTSGVEVNITFRLKLERGTIATDWSPAPEDAAATYATKTEVQQTASGLDTRITTAQNTADGAYLERTATGTTIDTTGAATIRSLVVEGKSVQDGTPSPSSPVEIQSVESRNILQITASQQNINGTTFTPQDDGSVIVNGTPSPAAYYKYASITLAAGTYAFSGYVGGVLVTTTTHCRIYIHVPSHNISTNSGTSFTLTQSAEANVYIQAYVNQAYNAEVFRIQLEHGTVVHPWQPYQHIKAAITGKNLLDLTRAAGGTSAGITVTPNGDGTFDAVGTATASAVNVWFAGAYRASAPVLFTLPAGTYTITDCALFSGTNRVFHAIIGSQSQTVTLATATPITGIRAPSAVNGTTYNTTIKPQLEYGSEATEYEPYTDASTYIPLNGHALRSLPDGTHDEMRVDSLGRVTMTQRVGAFVADSTTPYVASVALNGTTTMRANFRVPDFDGIASNNVVSDLFVRDADHQAAWGNVSFGEVFSTSAGFFFGLPTTVTDASSANAWFASNPTTVLYPLATPQTIDLGTIDLPTPADTLWLDAALVPTIGATWWTVDGIAGQQALDAEVTERQTLIRQFGGGVLAGYVGNAIAALVNAAGSFDVVRTAWANGVPSILGTLATFGANLIRIGEETGQNVLITSTGQLFRDKLNNLLALLPGKSMSDSFVIVDDPQATEIPSYTLSATPASFPTIKVNGEVENPDQFILNGDVLTFSGDTSYWLWDGQTMEVIYRTSPAMVLYDGEGNTGENIVASFEQGKVSLAKKPNPDATESGEIEFFNGDASLKVRHTGDQTFVNLEAADLQPPETSSGGIQMSNGSLSIYASSSEDTSGADYGYGQASINLYSGQYLDAIEMSAETLQLRPGDGRVGDEWNMTDVINAINRALYVGRRYTSSSNVSIGTINTDCKGTAYTPPYGVYIIIAAYTFAAVSGTGTRTVQIGARYNGTSGHVYTVQEQGRAAMRIQLVEVVNYASGNIQPYVRSNIKCGSNQLYMNLIRIAS